MLFFKHIKYIFKSVFYNDQLENMWECDIENDNSNNDDVVITIYNEEDDE